jgi:hypothetical protein
MQWIDEMFANMEKDRTVASDKRSEKAAKVDRKERVKEQSPGTRNAWSELVTSITNDVTEFNNHKERAGQTAVRMSQSHSQCNVHVPGMHGKGLVLTLVDNDLQVSVHPDFPKQQSSITIEIDKEGQRGSWVLGEATKESAKLSIQQLSEYLLKPVLSSASINREA